MLATLSLLSLTALLRTSPSHPATFPLGQKFYVSVSLWTCRTMISSIFVITAMSVFNRHFRLSYLIPSATRLQSEIIGCASQSPAEVETAYTQTTPDSKESDATNAPRKFFRQVRNSAIVPLANIEGGAYATRTDGLCPFNAFLASQADAEAKAESQHGCFANYTDTAKNGDGAA